MGGSGVARTYLSTRLKSSGGARLLHGLYVMISRIKKQGSLLIFFLRFGRALLELFPIDNSIHAPFTPTSILQQQQLK